MHSRLKTSLLMLTASCLLEAAPNNPNNTDAHPTPGTMKFTFDHQELGDGVKFESLNVEKGNDRGYKNCETWIHRNRSEFSVNWAKCVDSFGAFHYDVKIWFMFKTGNDGRMNVREIYFIYYSTTFLKHLYSGGEAKIVIQEDEKKRPTLKYVRRPNGEAVPLPGIMTFHVQIDMPNQKFRSARLKTPAGIRFPIFNDKEAKKFSIDWSECEVVDTADLEQIKIDIQNDLILNPEGYFSPVHTVVLPKEELEKFFAGGDAKIINKQAHGKPAGFSDWEVIYLNGPSAGASASSSGNEVEVASGPE